MNRRSFIHTSMAAGAGLATAGHLEAAARENARVGANDRVRIGVIGCKGQGWSNMNAHLKLSDVDCVALCDVDQSVLDQRAADVEKIRGKKPKLYYGDYRKLLEDKDIDAVIIGTPDHWHCLQMVDACAAGKDVYVEKPMANSIEECRIMQAAAKRYSKVVQVGQWQRSAQHFYDAIAHVHSGKLGQVRLVKAWAFMGWMKSIPKQPDGPVPAGINYDLWLGPAPKRPFNPNRFHFNFRWYWDYAGGLMTDWGVHLIDIALWGMKASAPKSILSIGGKFAYPDDAQETPDTQQALYDFGQVSMIWEHAVGISNGNYGRDHGIAFVGNNGTLVVDRGGWEVIPELGTDDKGARTYKMEMLPRQNPKGDALLEHSRNFVACMRSRQQPVCNPDVASNVCINAHMGNIAFKTGKRIFWDEAKGTFTDAQANELAKAKYHNNWAVPKV
jgi:predicted dehydrogenase